MRRIIFLSLVLTLLSCSSKNSNIKSPLSSSEMAILSKAKKFKSIFNQVSEIQLSMGSDHAISLITDMEIDTKDNFIIADGWQSKGVYIFTPDGNFIKELGQQGQGPGEYSTPVSIDINSNGDIFIIDYLNNRVNIYDANYKFKSSIIPKSRIKHFIHLNSNDEIYMYSGAKRPFGSNIFDTIYKYDMEGNKIKSFAPFPQKVVKVNMIAMQDGMTIDSDNYIYEMNPLLYNIRKYNSDGELLKSFSRKTKLFRIITDKNESPIIVYGPYYLEKGLIIVQVNKHLEIYDTEGNFIVGELFFPNKIICTNKNMIYIEKWDKNDVNEEQPNPKIICYELKI